jgi:hypothetical protein
MKTGVMANAREGTLPNPAAMNIIASAFRKHLDAK